MKTLLTLMTLLVILVGCEGSNKAIRQPASVSFEQKIYQIGAGDSLSVSVWKSPELSLNVPVRPDGRISVPLVGDVLASGKTTAELALELQKNYEKYVRSPQVTVVVLNPISGMYLQRVRITGAVNNPISIEYRPGMTVLDLVLEASGLTEFASGNRAKLYRKTGDSVEAYDVYFDDILKRGKLESNYELNPSDILTVPERSF